MADEERFVCWCTSTWWSEMTAGAVGPIEQVWVWKCRLTPIGDTQNKQYHHQWCMGAHGKPSSSSPLMSFLVSCRVRLSKRRAKAGAQSTTNAVLVCKHREMNEKELEAQVSVLVSFLTRLMVQCELLYFSFFLFLIVYVSVKVELWIMNGYICKCNTVMYCIAVYYISKELLCKLICEEKLTISNSVRFSAP